MKKVKVWTNALLIEQQQKTNDALSDDFDACIEALINVRWAIDKLGDFETRSKIQYVLDKLPAHIKERLK